MTQTTTIKDESEQHKLFSDRRKTPKIILGDMIYPPSICQAVRDLFLKPKEDNNE